MTETMRDFFIYFRRTTFTAMTPPLRVADVFKQLEFVAWQSLPVILFCVSFAAVVTIIESSFHMKLVIQNDALVPGFAAPRSMSARRSF